MFSLITTGGEVWIKRSICGVYACKLVVSIINTWKCYLNRACHINMELPESTCYQAISCVPPNMEEKQMKRTPFVAIFSIAVLTGLLLCSPAIAEITLSGDLEIDTSYVTGDTDDSLDNETTKYDSSGRIKISPSVRKESGNLYMEALAQILVKTTNEVEVDDAWGKIGTSTFDFQIGRFEGWDLFPKSNDMLIVDAPDGSTTADNDDTAPARYQTDYARGRRDSSGQFAIHVLPNETVGVEVALVYGNDTVTVGGNDYEGNFLGVRPVIDLKFGNFEVLGGLDYLKGADVSYKTNDNDDSEITKFGYGVAAKGTFGIATLGLNYAHGVESGQTTIAGVTTDNNDETTTSIGGYCDLTLGEGVLTLGGIMTTFEVDEANNDDDTHNQYYAAYAHPLPIDGATIKFAVSSATATVDDVDSSAMGFKVRLNYDF
jgi:hypothetical protein